MTVIVWDGRILAADRQATSGDTTTPITKIFRVGDCLAGFAGSVGEGLDKIDWLRNGAKPSEWEARWRDRDQCTALLVVFPNGTVWSYEVSPIPFRLEKDYTAIGQGAAIAMAGLICGRSAVHCVKLASRLHSSCGMGYDFLSLHPTDPQSENCEPSA